VRSYGLVELELEGGRRSPLYTNEARAEQALANILRDEPDWASSFVARPTDIYD
jgi:hypothetical protein